jgi:hypothetical protein
MSRQPLKQVAISPEMFVRVRQAAATVTARTGRRYSMRQLVEAILDRYLSRPATGKDQP